MHQLLEDMDGDTAHGFLREVSGHPHPSAPDDGANDGATEREDKRTSEAAKVCSDTPTAHAVLRSSLATDCRGDSRGQADTSLQALEAKQRDCDQGFARMEPCEPSSLHAAPLRWYPVTTVKGDVVIADAVC